MILRTWIVGGCAAVLLAGCAAAPLEPAANLADAGIKTTSAFGAEVTEVSEQLAYAGVAEAFTRTWQACANPNLPCTAQLEPEELTEERQRLADAVALRAKAIAALGEAYTALQAEAAYDEGADLRSAVSGAVESVNDFAAKAAALHGASAGAALVSKPIGELAGFGAELIGEQRQRKRLLAASRSIGAATRRLRDGMQDESRAFDSLTRYLVLKRSGARVALYEAGLTPPSDVLTPLAQHLDATVVPGADSIIAGSPRLQMALKATLEGMSQAEVIRMKDRYRISIAALGALIESHEALERKQPLSIGDVERFLSELDASLTPQPLPTPSQSQSQPVPLPDQQPGDGQ